MDDRESVGSRRQQMKKFSKMKVGHPKGVKTAMGQANPGGRETGMMEKAASSIRTAGVEEKRRLG